MGKSHPLFCYCSWDDGGRLGVHHLAFEKWSSASTFRTGPHKIIHSWAIKLLPFFSFVWSIHLAAAISSSAIHQILLSFSFQLPRKNYVLAGLEVSPQMGNRHWTESPSPGWFLNPKILLWLMDQSNENFLNSDETVPQNISMQISDIVEYCLYWKETQFYNLPDVHYTCVGALFAASNWLMNQILSNMWCLYCSTRQIHSI